MVRSASLPKAVSLVDRAIVAPAVSAELLGGRSHYERVLAAVASAHTSVWIATATLKELLIEDHRAKPGRRRKLGAAPSYRSVLDLFCDLAERGVELRILHAELPSRPFRTQLMARPELTGGPDAPAPLMLRRCPRVHLKLVIVDGRVGYLGSANWTGAGLGARGRGRRNFEIGLVTEDLHVLDHLQAVFEQIWSGGECAACKLRPLCPGPLDNSAETPPRRRRRRRTQH